jgi:hypothetical protein
VIIVVHEFVDAITNQGQAKEGGEDKENEEEGGVGGVLHS